LLNKRKNIHLSVKVGTNSHSYSIYRNHLLQFAVFIKKLGSPAIFQDLCGGWLLLQYRITSNMESIRQKQVGELLRRYISMILTEEGSNIYGRKKLVTVTQVGMTPDLLIANVYLSVYGTEIKQEVILEIEEYNTHLRQALAKKIGKQMRRMPELQFHLDDTVDEMYRVEALMNRVNDEDNSMGS
jgi:ribosome-binding factor A